MDITQVLCIIIENPIKNTARGYDEDEWRSLLDVLKLINNLFEVTMRSGKDSKDQDYCLNQFIGNNRAAVVVLVDNNSNNDATFQSSFWPYKTSVDQDISR